MVLRSLAVTLVLCLCAPVFAHAQSDGIPATINAASSRIRVQPDARAKIVVTLKKGAKVVAYESRDGWTRVRSGTRNGWLETSRLTLDASGGPTTTAQTSAPAPQQPYDDTRVADLLAYAPVGSGARLTGASLIEARVRSGGADLRLHPMLHAPVIRALDEGTIVTLIDRSEQWIKCELADATGWVDREHLVPLGTRSLDNDAAASADRDTLLLGALDDISDIPLRNAATLLLEDERRMHATLAALQARTQRNSTAHTAASATSEHVLRGMEADAARLLQACGELDERVAETASESDRRAAGSIVEAGRATLAFFQESLARARTAAPSPVLLYGGQFSFGIGSHTRSALYEYSSNAPTLQSSAWLNTPQYGNFRARLDWTDDIVTTRFTRLNTGVDWRLPMGTHQWSARFNYFRYDDEIPRNTHGLLDMQAGWEQLRSTGPALFARALYQGRSYAEAQPQNFTALSLHTGARALAPYGEAWQVSLLNRYQSSDDMGLNFDMVNAFGVWRTSSGFSVRPTYEGYFTLADSGGSFLNYHRPGVEVRWSRSSGITDYGIRADYRYHAAASSLSFGQATLFAGHRERGMLGTNWNTQLLYQLNNGTYNPSFLQNTLDARHAGSVYYVGFNAVTRYVLASAEDSLSQHFSDIYVNPGLVFELRPVRLEVGPFIGTTLFLNNKTQSVRDNLNNSARAGVSAHALASFGASVNVRAWGEYERAFHFTEDPYAGRTRSPSRLRIGAEAQVALVGTLSAFGRLQHYSINNDTGIKISYIDGDRDRDIIDDTLLMVGLRYHL